MSPLKNGKLLMFWNLPIVIDFLNILAKYLGIVLLTLNSVTALINNETILSARELCSLLPQGSKILKPNTCNSWIQCGNLEDGSDFEGRRSKKVVDKTKANKALRDSESESDEEDDVERGSHKSGGSGSESEGSKSGKGSDSGSGSGSDD